MGLTSNLTPNVEILFHPLFDDVKYENHEGMDWNFFKLGLTTKFEMSYKIL